MGNTGLPKMVAATARRANLSAGPIPVGSRVAAGATKRSRSIDSSEAKRSVGPLVRETKRNVSYRAKRTGTTDGGILATRSRLTLCRTINRPGVPRARTGSCPEGLAGNAIANLTDGLCCPLTPQQRRLPNASFEPVATACHLTGTSMNEACRVRPA